MNWPQVAEILSMICLIGGCFLVFAAGMGIMRFPDLLSRMHAGTKPQVLGLILVLVGAAFQLRDIANVWMFVLVIVFQLLTGPVAAHMVSQAAVRTGQMDKNYLTVDELAQDREAALRNELDNELTQDMTPSEEL